MEIKVWNTGRRYTGDGQRIAAAQVGSVVYFVDVDRRIEGCYKAANPKVPLSGDELQREVMCYYDGCNYEPIPRTEDGRQIRDALENAVFGFAGTESRRLPREEAPDYTEPDPKEPPASTKGRACEEVI